LPGPLLSRIRAPNPLLRIAAFYYSLCCILAQRAEAESKEKHGVWNPMPELTITYLTLCPLQSRLQYIYHEQPYARVDLNPIPEFIPQSGPLDLASRLNKDSKYIKYSKNIEEDLGEVVFVCTTTVSPCPLIHVHSDTPNPDSNICIMYAYVSSADLHTQSQKLITTVTDKLGTFFWQLVLAGKATWDPATKGRYLLSNEIYKKRPIF
jgi:hypothetical protein